MKSTIFTLVFWMIPLVGQPLVEVKIGHFFFSNAKMRNIYNRGGIDVQISGVYPDPVFKKILSMYGSVECLHKSGHSLGGGQRTKILECPLSLGLRINPRIANYAQWYCSAGPRYFIVRAHNFSSYVPKKIHKNGLGFFANMGLLVTIIHHLTFDISEEYSYGRLHFHSQKPGTYGESAQVGGFTLSGGLGYSF